VRWIPNYDFGTSQCSILFFKGLFCLVEPNVMMKSWVCVCFIFQDFSTSALLTYLQRGLCNSHLIAVAQHAPNVMLLMVVNMCQLCSELHDTD